YCGNFKVDLIPYKVTGAEKTLLFLPSHIYYNKVQKDTFRMDDSTFIWLRDRIHLFSSLKESKLRIVLDQSIC
ncbi:hypothetical protein GIB67_032271, partial [Kingdonia uniflora]